MASSWLVLGAGLLGMLAMWRACVTDPDSVRAFRRLARRHGLATKRPFSERLVVKAPLIRSLQRAADIQRLLMIAGRGEAPAGWILQLLGMAVLGTVGLLLLDLLGWVGSGRLPFPPALAFGFGLAACALGYVRLWNSARRRQQALQTALSRSFTELAMLTYTRQLAVDAALENLIAPSQCDGRLRRLFQDEAGRLSGLEVSGGIEGLDRGLLVSHATIYRAIGVALDVPAFQVLAASMRRINDKGQSPARVLTNLARTAAEEELATMMVRSEQARARQALPVGLMVAPLLLLLGFPLVAGLAHAFG